MRDVVPLRRQAGRATPKFACAISPDDVIKVRYRTWNGKVYAAVAATRLFWALGFATDAEYPVRVTCLGCPEDPWSKKEPRLPQVVFERAVIERYRDVAIAVAGQDSQWGWDELKLVDEAQGGSSPAQLDGAKLLAAFVQHTDNKAINQSLGCAREGVHRDEAGTKRARTPAGGLGPRQHVRPRQLAARAHDRQRQLPRMVDAPGVEGSRAVQGGPAGQLHASHAQGPFDR
jgi:hypothetical protein